MSNEYDFDQPPRARITVNPLAVRPGIDDGQPGNAGTEQLPVTSPYDPATEDFNPWQKAADRIRRSNVGKLPTPEVDWADVPKEFMRGTAESGYGAYKSFLETLEGRYYPEDLGTNPEKYRITDSGDFQLAETGDVLPRQHKPFIIPATRSAAGEIQAAMPGFLDMPTIGTPVKGAATLGAGLHRPPIPGMGHNQGPPLHPPGAAPPGAVPPPPPGAPPPMAPGAAPPPPRRIIHGHDDSEKPTWEKIYTQTLDDLNPIHNLQKEMVKRSGVPLLPDEQGYELARLTRGSHGRTQQALDNATFDFDTLRNNGIPLKKVLEPVRNHLKQFEDYAVALRDVELHNRGINPGRSLADAQAAIAKARPEFRNTVRQLHAYQDRILQYLADSGYLSDDALNAIRQANRSYVPFNRLTDQQMNDLVSSPKNIKAWDPIKKIIGSDKDILSPLETIVRNTHKFIDLAEKNRALKALVDTANRRGLNDLVERVNRAPFERAAQDEIKIWRDGKPEFYRVDQEVADAVNGMGREEIDFIARALQLPARMLRAGAVLGPEFLLKNMGRDQLQAGILSHNGYLPFIDYARGLGHMLVKSEKYQDWLKSGGANSNYVTLERRYIQDQLQQMKESGWYDKIKNNSNPLKFLEKASEYSEQPTRIGEFIRARNKGKTKHEAGFDAREVSVDFARHGASKAMQALSRSTAFFNPTLQGHDRIVRGLHDNPAKVAFMIGAYVTTPTLLAYAYNRTDPRMKDISRQERDTFWHFPTDDWQPVSQAEIEQYGLNDEAYSNWIKKEGNQTYVNMGTIYRFPKPHEIGVLFGSSLERTLDDYFAKDPDAFKGFQKNVASALLPPMIPTVAAAPIEAWSNYKFFTESPLVPKRLHHPADRSYEYGHFTTETAKIVGKAISQIAPENQLASPMVLENYVQNWGGTLGRYTLQIMDYALEKGAQVGAEAAGIDRKPKVKPEWSEADIPAWKAFVSRMPSTSAQPIRDFYQNLESSTATLALMNRLAKSTEFENDEQRGAARNQVQTNHPAIKLAKRGVAINRMFRAIENIQNDRNMTPSDKRKAIDMISISMIYAASTANEMFRQAKEQMRQENASGSGTP